VGGRGESEYFPYECVCVSERVRRPEGDRRRGCQQRMCTREHGRNLLESRFWRYIALGKYLPRSYARGHISRSHYDLLLQVTSRAHHRTHISFETFEYNIIIEYKTRI
jgi:hypothetical protein